MPGSPGWGSSWQSRGGRGSGRSPRSRKGIPPISRPSWAPSGATLTAGMATGPLRCGRIGSWRRRFQGAVRTAVTARHRGGAAACPWVARLPSETLIRRAEEEFRGRAPGWRLPAVTAAGANCGRLPRPVMQGAVRQLVAEPPQPVPRSFRSPSSSTASWSREERVRRAYLAFANRNWAIVSSRMADDGSGTRGGRTTSAGRPRSSDTWSGSSVRRRSCELLAVSTVGDRVRGVDRSKIAGAARPGRGAPLRRRLPVRRPEQHR